MITKPTSNIPHFSQFMIQKPPLGKLYQMGEKYEGYWVGQHLRITSKKNSIWVNQRQQNSSLLNILAHLWMN